MKPFERKLRYARAMTAPSMIAAALLIAAPARGQKIGDVFYIEMENHNLAQPAGTSGPAQLINNPAAPFLNSLMTPGNPNAAQTSYASSYYNAGYNQGLGIHPSEPNYVWQEAGTTGSLNDADPYPSNIVNAPNLSSLLQNAGISWKSYQEDAQYSTAFKANGVPTTSASGVDPTYTNPYNGSDRYNFAAKHDGSLFFTATNGASEAGHYATLDKLATDLANNSVARYNLITPDQYNDMHSSLANGFTYNGDRYTGDQSSIAAGDNFLSIIVPEIMASQAYKDHGAIVIWFDETEGGNSTAFTIPEIVISPLAKGNAFDVTTPLTHSSDLKSMEELFGVYAPGGGFLGDANSPGVSDLSGFFQPNAVPEPSTIALLGLGAGLGLLRMARRRA